jgi:hypothetical protein
MGTIARVFPSRTSGLLVGQLFYMAANESAEPSL